MPDTCGFEVVAEIGVKVLREFLKSAWDNGGTDNEGTIPHEVPIQPGLIFSGWPVDHGQVSIPQEGLSLEMAPADNGVTVGLVTDVQVAMDESEVPVPSLSFFDMTADISITAPFGIIPGTTVNIGVIFDNMPRDHVGVSLTSGDPIGSITDTMIEEYVHKRYHDDGSSFPHTITLTDQSFMGFTVDIFVEIFDNPNDPNHRISVQSNTDQVKVLIPIHLRISNIRGTIMGFTPLSPMGVEAKIAITAPLQQVPGQITAKLTEATIDVEDLTPADGTEGNNYNTNKTGYSIFGGDLDQLMKDQIKIHGQTLVTGLGDIVISVPTVDQIESFIGDQVHQELLARRYMGTWTPETPGGSPVTIDAVRPKALNDALAIGINPGSGADENCLQNFIPSGQEYPFAIALDEAFVTETIGDIVNRPEPEGFGGIPKHFDDVEGYEARLNSLNYELRSGAIHFWGDVKVYDVVCGADVNADFWTDMGMKWNPPDASGAQTLEPYIIDKDVDLPWWAWFLAVLGFLVGIIFGIIAIVIVAVVERIAERIGGAVMEDEVSNQLQTLGSWPQQLQGIGTVTSTFDEEVGIDKEGLLFSGPISITSTARFPLTAVHKADAGGPYSGLEGSPIHFHARGSNPTSTFHWDFGDGSTATGKDVTHTYAKSGLYVARLTIAVEGLWGATTHHSVLVRVQNVPPVVDAGPDKVANEGAVVSFIGSFTDQGWPDTHEAIWDFCDDSLPVAGTVTETNNPPHAVGTAQGNHAYGDNGDYIVKLRVQDDDGGVGIDTLKIKILNVPPTVNAGPELFAYPRFPITMEGKFTDPGWLDTHTGYWDFGDCTPQHPAVIREKHDPPKGVGVALVSHVYLKCGNYRAVVTVVDDDGGVGKDETLIRVVTLGNTDFEGGFRKRHIGSVANCWEPYAIPLKKVQATVGRTHLEPDAIPNESKFFEAEEFIVHGGQRSQRITGDCPFRSGIFQSIGANPGWAYQISVWYHLDERGEGKARLGIDPTGGEDPESTNVRWIAGNERLQWIQLVERVTACADRITIFLEVTNEENKSANGYFDDVALIPHQLPAPIDRPEEEVPEEKERCVDFTDLKEGTRLDIRFEKGGFIFTALDQKSQNIISWGVPSGKAKLNVKQNGVEVKFPQSVSQVVAHVAQYTSQPMQLEAYQDGTVISQAESPNVQNTLHTLVVKGRDITRVILKGGGNEAMLFKICAITLKANTKV